MLLPSLCVYYVYAEEGKYIKNTVKQAYYMKWTSKSGKEYVRIGVGDPITNSKNPEKYVDCRLYEEKGVKLSMLYMAGDQKDPHHKMLKLIAREHLNSQGYKIKGTKCRKLKKTHSP